MRVTQILLTSRSLCWKTSRAVASARSGKMKTTAPESPDKIPVSRFVSVDLNEIQDGLKKKESGGINFEDHKRAFRQKTTWEVARSLCVLRMSGINSFVDNGLSIMKWTRRVLGRKGLRAFFKPVLFKQFVGGENRREIQECLRRLNETGIRPMLAAAMEEDTGCEDVYDANCAKILECLEIAAAENMLCPMMQLKITALLPTDIVVALGEVYSTSEEKLTLIETVAKGLTGDGFPDDAFKDVLDDKKRSLFRNALLRLKKIGEDACCRRVRLLVDAEYTYLNPGLSLLTMAMVLAYNSDAPQIWNTYQCYLKDEKLKLNEEMGLVQQMHQHFGAKLVRGAYMEQERLHAQKMKAPDPVCTDYPATNQNYNALLEYLLEETKKQWPKCTLIVATHNEESIKLAIEHMKRLDIDNQNGNVSFGQLYGMCDQVTHALVESGYIVYKSIPYGTVEETLPYLARRAAENKSVLAGTRKEQLLLWKEMKYRLRPKWRRRSNTRT